MKHFTQGWRLSYHQKRREKKTEENKDKKEEGSGITEILLTRLSIHVQQLWSSDHHHTDKWHRKETSASIQPCNNT